MKMVKRNTYLVSTVATDALVLKHQGISSHSAQYAFEHFRPDLYGLIFISHTSS